MILGGLDITATSEGFAHDEALLSGADRGRVDVDWGESERVGRRCLIPGEPQESLLPIIVGGDCHAGLDGPCFNLRILADEHFAFFAGDCGFGWEKVKGKDCIKGVAGEFGEHFGDGDTDADSGKASGADVDEDF